ncbi:hypothetical protein BH10PAT4_BH10PAT4_5440 [soil metagenome]
MMVTKQYLISGLVRSLVIYTNFSKRITPVISTNSPTVTYTFDTSNPDYIYQNDAGYAVPIGGLGVSDNGKWMAVEFRQRGIGLLNLETFEMRRITSVAFYYGYGYDPSAEMAVSNDGSHVAIMGYNAGLSFYDVNPGCGELMTNDNMTSGGSPTINCPQASMFSEPFIDRFFAALHPTFNDDGSELRFYAASYNREYREVAMRAAGFEGRRIDYLALGDSYSSGEGETSDSHYLSGTNVPFEKCHVSDRSYPFLIARTMGIEAQYMRSVACSGAVMGDITGDDYSYLGQGGRLGKDALSLRINEAILFKEQGRKALLPGRIHQAKFVADTSPNVVTIGIGGNDAGFSDKLKSCLGVDTCEWASNEKGREKSAQEIRALFPKLVETYTTLQTASPNSKVYVVGYPNLIGTGECDPLHTLLLNPSEREFFQQAVVYLNSVVKAASLKAGVKYIDIIDSFGDSALCGSDKVRAMNGLKPGDDFPDIDFINWFKVIAQESFHPRPVGHQMIADRIVDQIPDLRTYDYCQQEFGRSTGSCPVSNVVAPQPADYWLVDGQTHGYESLRRIDFMDAENYSFDAVDAKVELADYSFAAGSDVVIEIHSDTYVLGTYRVDDNGSLATNIVLPQDLQPGFHTVHVFGKSYSGEPIDVYQVIKKDAVNEKENDKANSGLATSNNLVNNADGSVSEQPLATDQVLGSADYRQHQLDSNSKLGTISNIKPGTGNIFVAVGLVVLLLSGAYFVYTRVRRR